MSGERLQTIYSEQDIVGNETHVEHYSFTWTVKDFMTRMRKNEPQSLGTLVFHASERDECFTSWLIELNSLPNKGGECIVEFSLTRLISKNSSNVVFVRFFGDISCNETSKGFPLRIHTDFGVGDKISQTLIKTHSSPNSNYYFSPNGNLHILCEFTVFEKHAEEYISPNIREDIPDGLNELSSDMAKLCRLSAYSHISLSINSRIILCYKAVLSPRSCVLTEWMKNAVNGNCPRLTSPIRKDELDAFLKYIFSLIMDIYLKHTIPTGLNESEEELKLSDVQEYIDYVCQQNLAKLRTINVTWKIPFKKCLQNKFNKLHCPWKNKEAFDRKWQFQLSFSNNQKSLGIFVLRNADKSSIEFVKFDVKVIREEEVVFEKCCYLHFKDENFQGMPNFITKRQSLRFLSENILVLKCSLEILEPAVAISRTENSSRIISVANESFKSLSCKNMQNISETFKQLLENRKFSDAVIETVGQNFRIHSCILSVRLLTSQSCWKSSYKNIDPAFLESFIHYLYIYKMPKRSILDIVSNETMNNKLSSDRKKPIEEILEVLPHDRSLTQNPAIDANRGDEVDTNDASSQQSDRDNIENVSTEENENDESSKIHGDNSTNAGDCEKEAAFQNCISLHPSYVYNVQYSPIDENRDKIDRNGATSQHSHRNNIKNASTEENENDESSKIHGDSSTNTGDREEQAVFKTQNILHPSYASDEECLVVDANRDEQVVRNGAASQKSYFEDSENVSSVQNEINGSFKISDHYSKSAEDIGKQSIVENPQIWHPSHTYGHNESTFPTHFGYYTMLGNHLKTYPQPAFGRTFTPDQSTPVNASFIPAETSNTVHDPSSTKSYSKCNAVTNTLFQHPSLVNTGNYSTPLNNNQVSIPMTLPQFTNTYCHYNTCEPQYASNQIINQNYQSFYQPNYPWIYPYSMYGENSSYMPYNNAQASLSPSVNNSVAPYRYYPMMRDAQPSLSTVGNNSVAPYGYYPMIRDQSAMFHPPSVNMRNLPFNQNAYYETSRIQQNWSSADASQPTFQANLGFR